MGCSGSSLAAVEPHVVTGPGRTWRPAQAHSPDPSLAATRPAADGGMWIALPGYSITAAQGAVEAAFEGKPPSEAESMVIDFRNHFWGFLTVDANPNAYPKVLCRVGHPALYVGSARHFDAHEMPQASTLHIHFPPRSSTPPGGVLQVLEDSTLHTHIRGGAQNACVEMRGF